MERSQPLLISLVIPLYSGERRFYILIDSVTKIQVLQSVYICVCLLKVIALIFTTIYIYPLSSIQTTFTMLLKKKLTIQHSLHVFLNNV